MSLSDEAGGAATLPRSDTNRLRLSVFVSYSRTDSGFADQLVAALETYGFATTIDRKGIHGAENWERRLGELILESDTVVFVLTPASAESTVCAWEVDCAVELKKRVIPVVAAPLGASKPHEHLRDLNYIHFYDEPSVPGAGFGHGLARLVTALSVDVEWTREHTRLGALATRWQERDRPADLLLRGSELARLQRWRDTKPPDAPDLTTLQRDFLQASEDAENARESEERHRLEERRRALRQAEEAQEARGEALGKLSRRTRYGLIGLLVLAVVSVTAIGFVYLLTQNLEREREALRAVEADLMAERSRLEEASLRLREGMTLKIADTDHMVTTTEKWYRIATDYKLAIGLYHAPPRRANQGDSQTWLFGTGFLVEGEDLSPRWRNRVVFVTASHVIRQGATDPRTSGEPNVSNASIAFPGIDKTIRLNVESVLFESPRSDLDFAILALAEPPPQQAVTVDVASSIKPEKTLGGIAVLHWTDQDGFSLGFGHGLDREGVPGTHPMDRLFYTHVTGPGASGAPVFDASSGTLTCLHVDGNRAGPRPWSRCVPMSSILTAIRSDPPPDTTNEPDAVGDGGRE